MVDNEPVRRCFVCNREMPAVSGLALGWESEPAIFTPWRKQYRCPRHRRERATLATVGDIVRAKEGR